jgi:hypothetical protein
VIAHCEGAGANRCGGCRRQIIGVNSNPAKVMIELRFKNSPCAIVERLAGRAQRPMNDRRRCAPFT